MPTVAGMPTGEEVENGKAVLEPAATAANDTLDTHALPSRHTTIIRRYLPRLALTRDLYNHADASEFPARGERRVLVAPSGNQWAFEGMTPLYVVLSKPQEFADWLLRLTFSAERAGPCPRPRVSPNKIPWPVADA